ncbi:MAG: hypothetical protein HYU69_04125 [Bacteroidetes bacterium]|nr:hypothetical protein [Bacteroidota bacterium]
MLDVREKSNTAKNPHISCLKSHIYEVTFELGIYNPSFSLVIDPWLSYYGGNNREEGISVTTDKTGNVVFIGNTISPNFPTTVGATQTSLASAGFGDVFVVKMGAAGNRLWATYYGGASSDGAGGVACDGTGNVLVSGGTGSVNFPVSAVSHQTINGGGGEAFLIQFDSGGIRQWATYYGGTSSDWSSDVATDGANVYLYGRTSSPNAISTAGAFQVTVNAGGDAFVAKFTSAGSRIWATYIGGSKSETSTGIDCHIPSGNIFITGYTNSANYPLLNPGGGAYFQGFGSCMFPNIGFGCGNNSYVTKFSSTGVLLWSTYYGATNSGGDYAWGMTVDFAGNAIISGYTYSANLPIGSCCGNIVQQAVGGGQKGFLVKFNNAGVRLWATFLGGNQPVQAYSTAVDVNNNIYFVGEFEDANAGTYPISTCAYQTNFGGGPAPYPEDQFIAKYSPTGKQLCITYLGGTGEDDMDGSQNGGGGISVYGNVLYLTGITTGGYPVTTGAFQTIYAGPVSSNVYTGGGDAFISQLCINICEAKVLGLSYTASATNVCTNLPVTFTPAVSNSCDTTGYRFQWTFTGGNPAGSTLVKPVVTYPSAGNYAVKLVLTTACKKDSIINMNYITVTSCGGVTVTAASVSVCSGTCATVTANGSSGTGPYTYLWSNGSATQSINPWPSSNTLYTVTVTDNTGATATSTALVTVNPSVSVSITPTNINCSGASTGSATAAGGSGTPAYTYSWSNLVSGSAVSGLGSGSYTVTVTDSKGCTSTSTTTIVAPPALTGQFTKGTAACAACGCKEWLMVNATGGTSPYSYTWPDGYINRYKNQLCAGTYTINIIDKNGCSVNLNLTAP